MFKSFREACASLGLEAPTLLVLEPAEPLTSKDGGEITVRRVYGSSDGKLRSPIRDAAGMQVSINVLGDVDVRGSLQVHTSREGEVMDKLVEGAYGTFRSITLVRGSGAGQPISAESEVVEF